MNRKERRKINAADLEKARQQTQNQLAAVLLCVWLKVLHDEGVDYEMLCRLVEEVIDEYDKVEDWDAYQKEVYDLTGITITRTI